VLKALRLLDDSIVKRSKQVLEALREGKQNFRVRTDVGVSDVMICAWGLWFVTYIFCLETVVALCRAPPSTKDPPQTTKLDRLPNGSTDGYMICLLVRELDFNKHIMYPPQDITQQITITTHAS